MKNKILNYLTFTILLLFSLNAFAGKSCEETAQKPTTIEQAVNKAVQVNNILNNTKAKVGLIARVGQDLSKYNLKYSHVAFVYKNVNDSTWQIYHKLNTCGSDQSSLYIEGLANFFLDDMVSYDSKIFIPSEMVQEKLYQLLTENTEKIKSLHENHYNMLAYPFSNKYQNSNQWVLEVFVNALSNNLINNRYDAQQWLKLNNYQPTTLELGAMTRLGARMFKANIAFDDQPFNRRMSGYIDTVTVDSIYNFIKDYDNEGYFIENTL